MESTHLQASLREAMRTRYGVPPERVQFVWSPYRICPLGAHIDHQLGTVTAMAIDQGTLLAFAPANSMEVRLSSLSFPDEMTIPLQPAPTIKSGNWGDYARGAIRALSAGAKLTHGMVGITSGGLTEVGLSSSASIGVAYLLALEEVNGLNTPAAVNIQLDQAIENQYLGLKNGILDQSAILLSRRDQLTVIDCRAFARQDSRTSTEWAARGIQLVRPPASMPPYTILLALSGLTQAVLSTDYNKRVGECAEAASQLLSAAGRNEAAFLGNVNAAEYEAHSARLPEPLARRARHFFSEMERVRTGIDAWSRGDLARFGQLMTESGQSSIRDYECGSQPLIDLYEILIRTPGIYGARFSGAGFRGCCVALAEPTAAAQALPLIQEAFAKRQPKLAVSARSLLCQPDDGARIL